MRHQCINIYPSTEDSRSCECITSRTRSREKHTEYPKAQNLSTIKTVSDSVETDRKHKRERELTRRTGSDRFRRKKRTSIYRDCGGDALSGDLNGGDSVKSDAERISFLIRSHFLGLLGGPFLLALGPYAQYVFS